MSESSATTGPVRTICYSHGDDVEAARDFYGDVLGFAVAMESPVTGLASPGNPTAQVLLPPTEFERPHPAFGVDLGSAEAVECAHAKAVALDVRIVYPLTDENWGVTRFFVEDPNGTIINVLAHRSD